MSKTLACRQRTVDGGGNGCCHKRTTDGARMSGTGEATDMNDMSETLHIICERDVGLFSLIEQVISHIPWAAAEGRIPVVYFHRGTCYWTPNGYRGADTVWEYYFEPLWPEFPAASIPQDLIALINERRPSPQAVGYWVGERAFVSSHFDDHSLLRNIALRIPYQWDDPDHSLRRQAKEVINAHIRPRSYVRDKVDEFFTTHLEGQYVIGVHARGTDATSRQEVRAFRQGSLVLSRYTTEIARLLAIHPDAKIFVASDEESSVKYLASVFPGRVVAYDSVRHRNGASAGRGPTGWIMPGYIAADRDVAAQNGEEAVSEYSLLSRCDVLVHNGSSLARTVLLNAPRLPHCNTHQRPANVGADTGYLDPRDPGLVGSP